MDERALTVWRCCRDWPIVIGLKVGRCGYCNEIPEYTDKTIQEYMREREVRADG